MKIIGRSQMVSHLSYKEGIKTLLDLGYEGVEISIFNKSFKLREEFFEASTQSEMKKIWQQVSMTILFRDMVIWI